MKDCFFLLLASLSSHTEVDADPRRSVSGGVLRLTDVEFEDTAVYQCEATNKHGSILLNTYLHVVGTDTIRSFSQSNLSEAWTVQVFYFGFIKRR